MEAIGKCYKHWKSLVGSVVQAAGKVEFEDGLMTECLEDGSPPWRLLVSLWQQHLAYDQIQPPP